MEQYTTEQLKAMGYDEIQKLQIAQSNIQIINAELDKRAKLESTFVKEPKKK